MVKGCDSHRRFRPVALDAVDIALKNEIVRIVAAVASIAVVCVNDRDIFISVVLQETKFQLACDV